MTAIILGFAISYAIAILFIKDYINKPFEQDIIVKDLFQGAFLIFLFGGYWIALLILYIIEVIFNRVI